MNNHQPKTRKLLVASAMTLAAACALALANTDERPGMPASGINDTTTSTGSTSTDTATGDGATTSQNLPPGPTTGQPIDQAANPPFGQPTDQAGQTGQNGQQDALAQPTICTDSTGTLFSRGQAGFERCRQEKEQAGQEAKPQTTVPQQPLPTRPGDVETPHDPGESSGQDLQP